MQDVSVGRVRVTFSPQSYQPFPNGIDPDEMLPFVAIDDMLEIPQLKVLHLQGNLNIICRCLRIDCSGKKNPVEGC